MHLRKILIVPIAFLVILMAGCLDSKRPSSLLIAGATPFVPYCKLVAAAFVKANPGVNIICEGGSSEAALIATKRGAIDIGVMSLAMNRTQDDESTKSYLVTTGGIGIVLSSANPIMNLRRERIKMILSGGIQQWQEPGGPKLPISLVVGEVGSELHGLIEDMVARNEAVPKNARIVKDEKQMLEIVAKTPGAIGYAALPDIHGENLRAIAIDGVPLNRLTVLSHRYPLTRSFYFVVHDNNDENDTITRLKQKFLEFSMSEPGQKIFEKEGFVRIH